MNRQLLGGMVLLAAMAALALSWHFSSGIGPALYDGISLPSEPYRYLHTPPGKQATRPPTSARLSISASAATTEPQILGTAENPPQARLILEQNALLVPAATKRITITVRPVLPPAAPPKATIDGNVYQVLATTNSRAHLGFRRGKASLELRGTGQPGSPLLEQYVRGGWVSHKTFRYLGSNAIFLASINSPGDFALIIKGKAPPAGPNQLLLVLAITAIMVLLAAILLLLVRVTRQRRGNQMSAH